jgi:hypothetical protein
VDRKMNSIDELGDKPEIVKLAMGMRGEEREAEAK